MTLDAGFKGNQLKLAVNLQQQKVTLLDGTIEIPLDLAQTNNPDLLIPDEGPVKIALASRDVSLARLFEQFAKLKPAEKTAPQQKTAKLRKPAKAAGPVPSGTLNTTITAEGTIKDLTASVSKLQSGTAQKLAPADVALDLNLRDDRLKLSGTITQREIKPLTLSGELPLDVAALKKSGAPDMQAPIAFRMNLPRSPLGFITAIVPAIRFIDGTATINVTAGGTLAKPELSGSVQADIPHLRLADTSQPPVNAVAVGMDFTRDQITVRQLKGGLAGGSFTVGGVVRLEKLTEPVFDLRINTREALVMQDDNITTRITSDLRIAGPLNAGTVSGSVLVTKSRLFKDIDILPIGLPGWLIPQPPAESAPVSFPNPPLRDWKFDVAIKTADPFLIQGNLRHLGGGSGALDSSR